MDDQPFYADVDLPFHVWVRERGPRGARWVLRDASKFANRTGQRGEGGGEGTQGAAGGRG